MKTFLYSFFLLSCAVANAQEKSSLDQIIAKRDALLAEIYETVKSDKSGTRGPSDLRAAALELYSFRRDHAKILPDRIRWQEQIVEMEKGEAKDARARVAIGVMLPLDVTRAEERALAAEQKLLELQQTK